MISHQDLDELREVVCAAQEDHDSARKAKANPVLRLSRSWAPANGRGAEIIAYANACSADARFCFFGVCISRRAPCRCDNFPRPCRAVWVADVLTLAGGRLRQLGGLGLGFGACGFRSPFARDNNVAPNSVVGTRVIKAASRVRRRPGMDVLLPSWNTPHARAGERCWTGLGGWKSGTFHPLHSAMSLRIWQCTG